MTDREEQLDALTHHLAAAEKIINGLGWRDKKSRIGQLQDMTSKALEDLRKEWRRQNP
ncbi:hypothetical protein [Pararhodobacter marinus]|uniref:hypothetical protein n=1 Tax=Pararhodobacter marinus TaxID=2184063 RepID=UPI00143DE960|nr:hypothetical protein [Pararhodobacter marinus]